MFEIIQIASAIVISICFLLVIAYFTIAIIADITDNYDEDSILEKILCGLIKFNWILGIVPFISLVILAGYCVVHLWKLIL